MSEPASIPEPGPEPAAASLRLGEPLGQGAVATVHRVYGPGGRVHAGKRLHASHRQDEAAVARFAQEAELLQGLQHEHLVRVHGRVTLDGAPTLLMELVTGPTLAERIAVDAPLPPEAIRRLGRGIADGLAHAHRAGIVHRDLKPSNVLLAGGEVPKIADFGMARATSLAGVDAGSLTVLGTPDYMAPECLDPLAVDARADLYALGCILFEMATGRPPYSAATPVGVLAAHRDAPLPELPAALPEDLRALIHALLAKAPGDRPQAAEAVRDALDAGRASATTLAVRAGTGGGAIATAEPAIAIALATPSTRDRCVRCGAPLVVPLGVCTDCGHEIALLEVGEHTVLVTGPGQPGDKLDAGLRERLRKWLEDTPSLGLAPQPNLTKKIPRVPFPITGKVSERSGRSLVRALERLGLEAALVHGGPLASAPMRVKSRTLMGRASLIVLSCTGGLWHMGWIAAAFVGAMGVAAGTLLVSSLRRVTRDTGAVMRPLPPAVQRSIEGARKGLPAIAQRRHRQGLRAVLSRVVDLAGETGDDPEADEELARAADVALVATAQLDALDERLGALDRDSATKEARALLHARDTWASRLLSLTATLDAFAMRRAAAGARKGLAEDAERLERLRAHVEALEEVQTA